MRAVVLGLLLCPSLVFAGIKKKDVLKEGKYYITCDKEKEVGGIKKLEGKIEIWNIKGKQDKDYVDIEGKAYAKLEIKIGEYWKDDDLKSEDDYEGYYVASEASDNGDSHKIRIQSNKVMLTIDLDGKDITATAGYKGREASSGPCKLEEN